MDDLPPPEDPTSATTWTSQTAQLKQHDARGHNAVNSPRSMLLAATKGRAEQFAAGLQSTSLSCHSDLGMQSKDAESCHSSCTFQTPLSVNNRKQPTFPHIQQQKEAQGSCATAAAPFIIKTARQNQLTCSLACRHST